MGQKSNSVLVLVTLLLLLSLACNFPVADSVPGQKILCLLTGGTWVEHHDPELGLVEWRCEKGNPAPAENPAVVIVDPAAPPVPVEDALSPQQTVEPSDADPVDASQPGVPADISACATYDLAINYVNEEQLITNRYTHCGAQLAASNHSRDPMLVVWHLVADNDPAAGPEDVWKWTKLEPGEAVLLVEDLFTSKWNNGEYYYRKVTEMGMIRYIPECEQFYINLSYYEPPSWFAQVAKPIDEFSCP